MGGFLKGGLSITDPTARAVTDQIAITQSVNLDTIETDVSNNNAKISADGLVTTHSDVTSAGSGAIITAGERSDISGNNAKVSADGSVTSHSDVTDAGSGAIMSSAERSKLSGIEASAKDDQTASELQTALEGLGHFFWTDEGATIGSSKSIDFGGSQNVIGVNLLDTVNLDVSGIADIENMKSTNIEAYSGANYFRIKVLSSEPTPNPTNEKAYIYYNTTTNKLRVSENGGAFSDLVGAGGGHGTGLVTEHSDVSNAGSGIIISGAERTKLNGIATSATANDTDANLKNRANHSGTQLANTISDIEATITANTQVTANTAKTGVTNEVPSDVTGISGSAQITNMVSISQSNYDLLTPNASTLYVIV